MGVAARLAARARPQSRPNPAVGAIVIQNGLVVGRGWTMQGGRPHAEAAALAQAGGKACGATLYTTLEPCSHRSPRGPSCTELIIAAAPSVVVIAEEDPDPRTAGEGERRIIDAGIAVRRVNCPAAHASLRGYLMRSAEDRPHVTLKLAVSLDGQIALTNGESRWITGPIARAHVHAHRAKSDAILVGGATWRTDQPRLDTRLPGLEARSPDRYILTRGVAPEGVRAISSPEAISDMGDIQYLYVEGGAQTAAAFLAADLVDTLHLYRAPIVIGGGRPAVGELGLTKLEQAHDRWKIAERRMLGSDAFESYERAARKEKPCSPE